MRFCPKCGYEDPLCWHSYRWITDIDMARFEEFQLEYPQWAELKPSNIVEDQHCFYRRTGRHGKRVKGAFILRWPKMLGKDYYKSRFFERFKAKRQGLPVEGQKILELEASC